MAKDNPRGQLDATARYAIKLSPLDNLRWVAEGLSADLTFSRWIDTQMVAFPGEPRRSCDTVAELKSQSGNEPPWALVIEVEARPKRMTPARMVEYLARLLRKIRYGTEKDPYQVAGAVIVLTGEQKAMKREMVLPGAGMGLAWQIGIVNVSMRNARETLEKIRAGTLGKGILPWIPLMAGAEEPATVSEWGQLALSEVD